MRKKTYLTPEEQWDKTAVLAYCSCYKVSDAFGLGKSWLIGRIVRPHKLFLCGDFVIFTITNGMAERQQVYAVSGKGIEVERFYLGYRAYAHQRKWTGGKYYLDHLWLYHEYGSFLGSKQVIRRKRCRRPLRHGDFEQGPMRWVEVPDNLVGCAPDDPRLRQFIVALAREGSRMPGKRE
jgi:hypothetical protein